MGLKVGAMMKYVKNLADGRKIMTQTMNGKTSTAVFDSSGRMAEMRVKSIERYPVGDKNVITTKTAELFKDADNDINSCALNVIDKVYSQEGKLLGTRVRSRCGDRALVASEPGHYVKDLYSGNISKSIQYDNGIRTFAKSRDGIIKFDKKGLPDGILSPGEFLINLFN